MKRFTAILPLCCLLLCGIYLQAEEKTSGDTISLVGTYQIVSGEKNGAAIPARRLKNNLVVIAANTVVATDKDKQETFAATYILDQTKNPWTISLTSTAPKKGALASGLVKRDGEKIWLIYSHSGGDAPNEFKTKDKQLLFVLEPLTPHTK